MTAAHLEAGRAGSGQWTGDTLYDPVLLDPEEYAADQSRTQVVPTGVNPDLQDVLAKFHDALIHKLTGLVARISLSSMRGSPGATSIGSGTLTVGESRPFGQYWLPTNYVVASQAITFTTTNPFGALNIAWGTGITHLVGAEIPGVLFLDTNAYISGIRKPVVAHPTAQPLAVQAVEDIANWLGVPVADVFRATGIAKRTYHEWKRSGTRRPRASSEGHLWELHHLAADLVETMGRAGVRYWLSEDPARRKLLRSGAMDKLAAQAYASLASTGSRPDWVDVGSPEDRTAPRRDITLGSMDPGDVVEPES